LHPRNLDGRLHNIAGDGKPFPLACFAKEVRGYAKK